MVFYNQPALIPLPGSAPQVSCCFYKKVSSVSMKTSSKLNFYENIGTFGTPGDGSQYPRWELCFLSYLKMLNVFLFFFLVCFVLFLFCFITIHQTNNIIVSYKYLNKPLRRDSKCKSNWAMWRCHAVAVILYSNETWDFRFHVHLYGYVSTVVWYWLMLDQLNATFAK